MSCDVITGDVAMHTRMAMQDKFNNDPNVKHLVLTLDVGREGLNLTGASKRRMPILCSPRSRQGFRRCVHDGNIGT